jgi:hypothetical protein
MNFNNELKKGAQEGGDNYIHRKKFLKKLRRN